MKILNKVSVIAILSVSASLGLAGVTRAATATVDLGTATPFAILAGTAITNVPTSTITGNVGLSPYAGTFYDSGVTQAQVTGTIYSVNAAGPAGYVENPGLLTIAKNDLTAAYTVAEGRTPVTTINTELGGQTLVSGVYASGATTMGITAGAGPLILDGQNDPSSVFIFEVSADAPGLTVGPGSVVELRNMASACNVFWRVNTATINTTAVFKGNILALNSITVANGANIEGRLLARNGNVTLDHTTVAVPICTLAAATSTPTPTPVVSATSTPAPAITPKLPKTGITPDERSISWNIIPLAGILLLVSASVAVAIRKRTV